MVIFRENTEDIYAGIEFREGTPEAEAVQEGSSRQLPEALQEDPVPGHVGIGIKPVSREGTSGWFARRIDYAIENKPQERHAGAQGQHHEVHRGRVPRLGLRAGEGRVRRAPSSTADRGARCRTGIVIKDVIADAFLQQILTRPAEYDVIATPNLNGDYISDALAAQVGGIGIAPGGNINYVDRPRGLRGDPRHRAEVREPGQGQPGLGDPLRRDDAPLHGLERGGRPVIGRAREDHRRRRRDLRPRAADGRRDRAQDVGVRRRHHREHVVKGLRPHSSAADSRTGV